MRDSIALESRRYIGNKAKLVDWIAATLHAACPDANSFCDIFAGTGIVAAQAAKRYRRVVVNDLLHANRVIYQAFLGPGEWDGDKLQRMLDGYNALDTDTLPNGYFTRSYADRYFETAVTRLVDYVRGDIERQSDSLTPKEHAILLATLIYNIDRHANTVGHFDAYIKRPIAHRPLLLRPVDAKAYPGVEIHQEDANTLADTVDTDITYIDPPYNSRQYSRFYHVYETLVKWDEPALYGVALKPKPENLSRYCTTAAPLAFQHLIAHLHTRYIAVSYNNTYHSKSKSSENKIRLEQILRTLELCGPTQVFEHSHAAFNTGKTEFKDHKELLFLTEVDEEKKRKSFANVLCWG